MDIACKKIDVIIFWHIISQRVDIAFGIGLM